MGLELVEIVMDVEQTFGIRLPQVEMPAIQTVGQLRDCIAKALAERLEGERLEQHVFDRLREAVESVRRMSPGQITPNTPLHRILPVASRRRVWRHIKASLPWTLPPLRRPPWVGAIVTVAAVALAWLCTFGSSNPKWVTAAPAIAMACLFFIGPLAAFFAVVGVWLTTPLAVVWRPDIPTVGDLARAVVAINFTNWSQPQRPWSDDEIWNALRQIVAEVLGVDPAKVTREARFVEDLGAG